jgi:hypothetical protein
VNPAPSRLLPSATTQVSTARVSERAHTPSWVYRRRAHGPTLEYHQLPHGSSSHSLNCEGWVCIERVQVGARTLSARLCVCSSPHWCVDAAAGCASRGAARAGGDGACTWMALRSRSTCPPWSDVGEEWNGVDVQGTDVGGEWNDVAWGL